MAAARAAVDEIEHDAHRRRADRRAPRRRHRRRRSAGPTSSAMAARPARRRPRARRRRRPPGLVVRAAARAGRRRERAGADRGGGDRHRRRRPRADRGRGARRHARRRRDRLGRCSPRRPALSGDAGVVRRRVRSAAAVADDRRRSSSASPSSAIDPWSREVEALPASLVAHVVGPARSAADGRACGPSARWHPSCCAPGSCRLRSPRMAEPSQQITMSDDEVVAYLDEQKVLNVATIGPTGHPHVVAMWYVVLDGKPAFWTFGKSQKIINIRRDPKITGLVESGDVVQRAARRRARRHGPADRGLRRDPRPRHPGRRRSTAARRATTPCRSSRSRRSKRIGVVIDVERSSPGTTPSSPAPTERLARRVHLARHLHGSGPPFETTAKRALLTVRLVPA